MRHKKYEAATRTYTIPLSRYTQELTPSFLAGNSFVASSHHSFNPTSNWTAINKACWFNRHAQMKLKTTSTNSSCSWCTILKNEALLPNRPVPMKEAEGSLATPKLGHLRLGPLATRGQVRLVGVTYDSKIGSLATRGFFKGNTFRVKNGAYSPALGGTWGLGVHEPPGSQDALLTDEEHIYLLGANFGFNPFIKSFCMRLLGIMPVWREATLQWA